MKIVIVGAGEVGFHIASRLAHEDKDVVIIDVNPAAIRRVSDNLDVQVVEGSGSSPVVLQEAGIKEAEILLAVTDRDETNLVTCLVADLISSSTKKLARIRDADYDEFHAIFSEYAPHIDTIIDPEIEVVKTIDRLMSIPEAVDVGEFADGRIKFVGVTLDASTHLAGVRLGDIASVTGKQPPLIAAVIRNEELIIPGGNNRLEAGDLIYFISETDRLSQSLEVFDKSVEPIKRVLIIGGGRLGSRLATVLEKKSIDTKIIEKEANRCLQLVNKLNKAIVLHGDGSDQGLLSEENIQDMDLVVTLTHDEETNIIVSLFARRMGVPKTITRISKFSYFPLMSFIGLDQVVSTRHSAINSILQYIRRGKVLSAISIKDQQAEVIEVVAPKTSDIVGKPLKRISLPKGVLVAGITRNGQVIIPSGKSIIEPNDRIVIFASRPAIPKIEKILAVKLEYF